MQWQHAQHLSILQYWKAAQETRSTLCQLLWFMYDAPLPCCLAFNLQNRWQWLWLVPWQVSQLALPTSVCAQHLQAWVCLIHEHA